MKRTALALLLLSVVLVGSNLFWIYAVPDGSGARCCFFQGFRNGQH